jgi:hypothetical protein
LEDADLDGAKHLFGVKFWGSVVTGKGREFFQSGWRCLRSR